MKRYVRLYQSSRKYIPLEADLSLMISTHFIQVAGPLQGLGSQSEGCKRKKQKLPSPLGGQAQNSQCHWDHVALGKAVTEPARIPKGGGQPHPPQCREDRGLVVIHNPSHLPHLPKWMLVQTSSIINVHFKSSLFYQLLTSSNLKIAPSISL